MSPLYGIISFSLKNVKGGKKGPPHKKRQPFRKSVLIIR